MVVGTLLFVQALHPAPLQWGFTVTSDVSCAYDVLQSCHHKVLCVDQKLTCTLFSDLNKTKLVVKVTSSTSTPLTLILLLLVLVWPLEH